MSETEKYKSGAEHGDWFIAKEGLSYCVKRMVTLPNGTRSARRAPAKDYKKYLLHSAKELDQQALEPGSDPKPPRALEDYVIRLNGKDPIAERLKAKVRFSHGWLNDEFLQQYKKDELYSNITDRTGADANFNYLLRYALHWFVTLKGMHSPLEWKDEEKEWGRYLMNRKVDQAELEDEHRIFRDIDPDDNLRTPKDRQLSAKVLSNIVFEVNRFVGYIYKKRRNEFEDELVKIEPWGDELLKSYEAEWRLKNPTRPSKYIKAEHWEIIKAALEESRSVRVLKSGEKKIQPPPNWRYQVYLAHDLGLRRNEALAADAECVRKGKFHIVRQIKKVRDKAEQGKTTYGPLKGREPFRDIPYWFTEAKQVYAIIKKASDDERGLPHPDTISSEFRALCRSLKDKDSKPLPEYWFHDLRRTFITNAVKKGIAVEDLRLAVGHKDQRTTMKFYVMDSRQLEDDLYIPEEDDFI